MKPTFSLSHFPTRSPSQKGYTFLEILAVVTIMALSAAVMAPVVMDTSDQELTVRTLENLEAIRTAVLGAPSDRVRNNIRFAGYARDMGALPDLYDVLGTPEDPSDDQPRGLWTSDPAGTPGNSNDDLPSRRPYAHGSFDEKIDGSTPLKTFLRMGWRGPYIRPPAGAALEDGWKNPLRFELIQGGIAVTSLGADAKKGGEGFNRDITLTIKKRDWTGLVVGYVSPLIRAEHADENGQVALQLYYAPDPANCEPSKVWAQGSQIGELHPVKACCRFLQTMSAPDGFFRFEGVPVGTDRFLLAGAIGYKVGVEPGLVWLGTPGVLQ
jgi:prepilin-type N-terminal cleavage/methylation domain-containing protein